MKTLDEILTSQVVKQWKVNELQIQLCLQPRPCWLPPKLYHWLLKRLLYTTEQKKNLWEKNWP